MKPFSVELHNSSDKSLYIQLYEYLKNEITCGNMGAGEKLPSLRSISKSLGVSITTTEMAYNQLLVEGYVVSRPQSGYYVAELSVNPVIGGQADGETVDFENYPFEDGKYKYDLSSFDFVKWKKCRSHSTECIDIFIKQSERCNS